METILAEVREGILLCEASGRVLRANRPARVLLGPGPEADLQGAELADYLVLPGNGSLAQWAREAEASESCPACTLKSDASRTIGLRVRNLPDEPDTFLVFLRAGSGTALDCRAHPSTGSAREETDRLAAIIDSLPIATFAVDNTQQVIAWNREVEEMTGISAEEMVGQRDYAYALPFWGERRPLLIDLIQQENPQLEKRYEVFRRMGDTAYAEVQVPKLYQGSGAYVTVMATALYDSRGRRLGAVECIQDITEARKAQQQLRTSERQLRQAQRMESIGRLAGGIAHDFNNQLTIVEGYCDLLLRDHPDEETREGLLEIRQASSRATRLTAQLLAFGRRQVLQPEVLDLVEVLRDIENPLARMIGEDIKLQLISDTTVGNVRVDRNQLQQVVMNLAVNARDAMPTGGRLTLELANVVAGREQLQGHPEADPGRYVLLKVEDTGLGMDSDTLSRAFEPFFTTKPVGEGTGLGLSMVYGFVSQSGGFVDIESTSGEGTQIRLYLPRVEEDAVLPLAKEMPAEPRQGSGTILVVEDEQRVEKLLNRVLGECGYHVLSARNTPDALKLAQEWKHKLDLLITDVVMPGQSGLELASLLRKEMPDLKVLFISGYAHDIVLRHGAGKIEGEILAKPFTPEGISDKVAEILQSREYWEQ